MNNIPLDPQQIIAQILSANKNRGEVLGGSGGCGSSSNNSSSSRTGGSKQIRTNEHCDMTIQSEYENVRAPMMLPGAGNQAGGDAPEAASGKGQRRLGRQKSRYTSGKWFI